MKLSWEIRLGVAVLVGLQILLAMLAISVLSRMGPAIERILEDNVYSVEAVEEMLGALARAEPSEGQPAFEVARSRAKENQTEAEEGPPIEVLEADAVAAFEGDAAANARVLAALATLGDVNRASMRRADARAKELGSAGAWAAALLGAFSLVLGVVAFRRLQARIEEPLAEVHRTLRAVRGGNGRARCGQVTGPVELGQVCGDLNWLLDHRAAARGENEAVDRDAALRRALALLSERCGQKTLLLEGERLVFGERSAFDSYLEDAGPWTELELGESGVRMLVRDAEA